jgi:5-formyltetrahydrofolate cyclo-ligase
LKKIELRAYYKSKREEVTENDLIKKSEKIAEKILQEIDLENKTVSIFLPIKKQKEINTFLIIEEIKNKCRIAVSKSNFSDFSMQHYHYAYENENSLVENEFGIPEPLAGIEIKPTELDIVFVPLFTIDSDGNRVGFGKGFYDRFLNKCKPECVFIGLNLFENIDQIDDVNQNDIKLDLCITPYKTITFNSSKKIPFIK